MPQLLGACGATPADRPRPGAHQYSAVVGLAEVMEEHAGIVHAHGLAPAQLMQGFLARIGHACIAGKQAHAVTYTGQAGKPDIGG
ncbi:hypothetical protein D3C76_1549500 [compost metagenome]